MKCKYWDTCMHRNICCKTCCNNYPNQYDKSRGQCK